MSLFTRQSLKTLFAPKDLIPIAPLFLFLIFAGIGQDIKVSLIFLFLFVAFMSFFLTVAVFKKMQDGQLSDKPLETQALIESARVDILRMMRAGLVRTQNASMSEYYRLDFHDLKARIENMTLSPVGDGDAQEALYRASLDAVAKSKNLTYFEKRLLDNMMHARLMHTLPVMSAHEVMEMNAKMTS